MKRRDFLKTGIQAATLVGAAHLIGASNPALRFSQPQAPGKAVGKSPLFTISLAEWSLHRALRAGEMTNLDFPVTARRTYEIDGVEYVNSFFKDKARDAVYLKELKSRCDGEGVESVLIMCDGEGRLGDPDETERRKTVENHHRWVDAAKFLGCHSIRVNAASEGSWETQRDLAADGLSRLTEYGAEKEINIIVENHGGISSNGEWLASVIRQVDNPRCGTLPDFGNFQTEPGKWYDRYKGVAELMPFAKAVSAKTHVFDDDGNEREIDYFRMMRIVMDAGYHGRLGIEFEGDEMSEKEGILTTRRLLERTRDQLTEYYGQSDDQ
jgi:L-ribulose-5-phosphate 3-epimerase